MSDLNVYGKPLAHTGPGTGPSILGVNWAFASPAIIAVGLRMWFRRKAGHGLDDWLMVVATAMLIVYEALLTTAVIWGLGRQFVSVTLKEYGNLQFYLTLSELFVNLQPVLSRWSIAVFLIRLFGTARIWFKYFLIIWVSLMGISAVLANILTYTYGYPLDAYWNPTLTLHYRFSPYIQYYTALVAAWLTAVSDLTFAIFPITFIWSLQLESRKKIGLTALFSGSLLAFLASLAKIIYSTLSIRGESGAANGDGAASGILWITSGIEQSLVIILGTAPALGPLARMQIFNNVSESFVNLITFGHRSRRSPVVQSMHHEELELGQPRRLTDDGEESGRGVLQFVDGTLTTIDAETAKYVKRTDDFAVMGKAGHGRLS